MLWDSTSLLEAGDGRGLIFFWKRGVWTKRAVCFKMGGAPCFIFLVFAAFVGAIFVFTDVSKTTFSRLNNVRYNTRY